jgi:hypothetical protein
MMQSVSEVVRIWEDPAEDRSVRRHTELETVMPYSPDPEMLSEIQAAHGQLDGFFQSSRDALAGSEAKIACSQLRDALETHFAQEESLYFPTLWKLRPEVEQVLRGLIAAHAGFLERLDQTARFIDDGAPTDAQACFDELQHRFALHEASEEQTLRSLA